MCGRFRQLGYVPEDISNRLFGKQKSRTDLDVIASLNNNLLVMECKETKYSAPSPLKISEQNLFEKYSIEHYYRAKWIAGNLSSLRNYVGTENWKLLRLEENKPINVLPLLVVNNLLNFHTNEGVPLLTFSELKEIVSKNWVYKSMEDGMVEAEIQINT
jgi:Holliday junction resolvase